MRSVLAFILLFPTLVPSGFPAPQDDRLEAIVQSVRAKYAPDRRVAVFNIQVKDESGNLVVSGELESEAAQAELLQGLRLVNGEPLVSRIVVLPDPLLGDRRFGLVRVSVANLRREPDHASELVTQAVLGTLTISSRGICCSSAAGQTVHVRSASLTWESISGVGSSFTALLS